MKAQPASTVSRNGADWLPVYTIARALNCHRGHIVHLIEAGELEAIDLRAPGASRSAMRVSRQSLIEWLESRSVLVPPSQAKFEGRGDKRARISPTKSRRDSDPARALLALLRAS